ncbi:hypothetical protein PITC_049270 [Penicillium italicum]|uniref:Uncharacterized protein n=1 Tax=Penicillium italicum TaxID=40296 RepID=A0A0A2KGR1_PENIT|nr:hypothetical protein PITC_049270 [Penicillium italicum]
MEGEGKYFKACILRKARRVHVANSKKVAFMQFPAQSN